MRILALYQGQLRELKKAIEKNNIRELKHFPLPLYTLRDFVSLGEEVFLLAGSEKKLSGELEGIHIHTYPTIKKLPVPLVSGGIVFLSQIINYQPYRLEFQYLFFQHVLANRKLLINN